MVAVELLLKLVHQQLSCPLVQETSHPSLVVLECNQRSMIPTQEMIYPPLLVVLLLDCLVQIVLWVFDQEAASSNQSSLLVGML
jgi:hypothetical protein